MKKHSKRLLTAAALVMTTTATIHIINKVIAASACLKEMLDTDVRNYYHWRFGDIYYTKKGKGSPILLIDRREDRCYRERICSIFCCDGMSQ